MNCAQYIFKLTAGQLGQDAPARQRMAAALHRLECRQCRDFTRNDAALDAILHSYRQSLQGTEPPHAGDV